ncbi:MAG: chromate transporter [Peptococcaceae bacterium]|nr:chromate transporter [Peptococcaceae bacterium]
MLLLRLYLEFFKTGLFAVGGGLATVPFLTDMADKTGWFSHAELANMIAISESTPGPMGVNMATYVGFTTAGIPGAIIATLGLITPSIIVILLVARVLAAFRTNKIVAGVFYGLRPASVGLIAAAGVAIVELALVNVDALAGGNWMQAISGRGVILAILVWLCARRFKPHPAVLIAASAVVGVVFHFAGV